MLLRSSTSTPAVGSSRNRICGSWASAFAIMTRRFMPPESVMILLLRRSSSDKSFEHLRDMRRAWAQAEQPPAERNGIPNALERVGRKLLRHEPDQRAGRAVVPVDVVPIDRNRTAARVDGSADDADERGLARTVGTEQRENLAAPDVEAHALQRLKPGSVFLGDVGNGDDGVHVAGWV